LVILSNTEAGNSNNLSDSDYLPATILKHYAGLVTDLEVPELQRKHQTRINCASCASNSKKHNTAAPKNEKP